ncbi:hypothetical protein HYX14_05955 [Candidatus Woesearchaeota archaeon]|nr:hypothetical protein [Candidatus Woesearchaeota archaeon]
MLKPILFRAVIEVLGKPKEHVEQALQGYLEKLKQDAHYQLMHTDRAEIQKQEKQDLWAIFAEVEVRTDKIEYIIDFCFEYMPSSVEVIEPTQFSLSDTQVTDFLNDLQAKLHTVDMIAKQVKLEDDIFKKNLASLLHNYVRVLLAKGPLTSEQLSKLTGVSKDQLEDFMDQLIDKGVIDLKKGVYSLIYDGREA